MVIYLGRVMAITRAFLLLVCALRFVAPFALAQDTIRPGFSFAAHYGLSLPLGRFGGNPGRVDMPDRDQTAMLGAGATSGAAFGVSSHYTFASGFGVFLSATRSMHDPLNENYQGYPWGCTTCGHGYIAPTAYSASLDVGRWSSVSALAGSSYTLVRGGVMIRFKAGLGYQHWLLGEATYRGTGIQMVAIGDPPYVGSPFERNLVQAPTRGDGAFGEVGMDVRGRIAGPIFISLGASVSGGAVKMEGEQVHRYDGASQSQSEVHWSSLVPYEERSSMTRMVLLIGLTVDPANGRRLRQ